MAVDAVAFGVGKREMQIDGVFLHFFSKEPVGIFVKGPLLLQKQMGGNQIDGRAAGRKARAQAQKGKQPGKKSFFYV